ncbi:MAG: hypothetical protein LBF61_02725 [Azoarcus sp.]|jgi:prophage antirepressor-like protein|nr:hypothetical protein [Azoarcus sp.]
MTQLIPGASAPVSYSFHFNTTDVRIVVIDGTPWFAGRDVAAALGYVDTVNALKRHCRGVAKRHPIPDGMGREQETRLIQEPDVFRLIINSHRPAARAFERLVFETVLPSIRKTGGYQVTPAVAAPTLSPALESSLQTMAESVAALARGMETIRRQMDVSGRYIDMLEKNQRGQRKITAEVYREIQTLLAQGMGVASVARHVRVSHTAISLIKHGKYPHVPVEEETVPPPDRHLFVLEEGRVAQ